MFRKSKSSTNTLRRASVWGRAPRSDRDDEEALPPRNEDAFARYVRGLDAPASTGDGEGWEEMRRALLVLIKDELRSRGLWNSSPSYLGIDGYAHWWDRQEDVGPIMGPLDELLGASCSFIFVERIHKLRSQLEVSGSIGGTVRCYLRNYLHDRRKRHDLLGFWIFESLRQAVRRAIDREELWIVGGSEKILNGTILATRRLGEPTDAASPDILEPIAKGWVHGLLPELITASGSHRRQVVELLRSRLSELDAEGSRVFRFGDLVEPFKREVRSSWAAVFDDGEGESGFEEDDNGAVKMVHAVRESLDFENRDVFEKLLNCVASHIRWASRSEATERHLCGLLGFLRVFASDPVPEDLPSWRCLGEQLCIPRKRLPHLFQILGSLVARCRAALRGGAPPVSPEGDHGV